MTARRAARPMRIPSAAVVLGAAAVVILVLGTPASVPRAQGAANHTVTFVNQTGASITIHSEVNADGSQNVSVPAVDNGGSATVTIPENEGGHWRGRFWAQSGEIGASAAEASLAEFNFDPADASAPWYDVSYVDAVTVPITIDPVNASSGGQGSCSQAGCPGPLLDACPANYLQYTSAGQPKACINPNPNAVTDYSAAITSRCPTAYSWAFSDSEPGNQAVHNCSSCTGFVVTFHSADGTSAPAPSPTITDPGSAPGITPAPADTTPAAPAPAPTDTAPAPADTAPHGAWPPWTRPTGGWGGRR